MALEFGSGTQADPYLLVNLADVQALFNFHLGTGKFFALTNDLDLSKSQIVYKSIEYANFKIDGRGHRLFLNIKNNDSGYNYIFGSWSGGELKNIWIKFIHTGQYHWYTVNTGFKVENSVVEFSSNSRPSTPHGLLNAFNSLIIGGDVILNKGVNTFKDGALAAQTINTNSFLDGNKFNRNNYPLLDEERWIFDGVSLPRPRPQATADLSTRYGVKGKSNVGEHGRQRQLAVFTENGLRYKAQDTKADGSFFVNLNDVSTPVIVLAYDDIGANVAINTTYNLNQIIHPSTPNGFRYRCTLAGNSGATIPSEPWSTSAILTIGAAKFTPEPVYEPKAHGPLRPVLFNVLTEQPV
ncbi:hypothetical protein [Aeromonas veronii]|uniref:hypothetical protein n=1 Tax=Aeromonas veronii TaxID=654 RepID=UPI003F7A1CE6